MQHTIAEYERQNLEPRSWELAGEVAAHEREQDGLLKQYIEVDYKATQAPVIDEDVNARIESIVKKRIKDKVGFWDSINLECSSFNY
jgi:U3 small nucleolar ribonucleoprotein component